MYEKSIRQYGDYFVVRVRYPDGSRFTHWCGTFDDARLFYDSLRPEVGDRAGYDSAIRSDVVYACQ